MTNPQFGFDELAANQAQPHITVNEADRGISQALAGQLDVNFPSDANMTLGAEQWQYGTLRFTKTGTPLSAPRDVIYPDVDAQTGGTSRHQFTIINATTQTLTIKRSGQAGVEIEAGATALVRHSGTDIRAVSAGGGGGTLAVVGQGSPLPAVAGVQQITVTGGATVAPGVDGEAVIDVFGGVDVSGQGSPGATVQSAKSIHFTGNVEVHKVGDGAVVDILDTGGGGGGGGGGTSDANVTPDSHPTSPNAMDDEFEAAALDTVKWTWRNQGGATLTQKQGAALLSVPGSATTNHRIIEQTLPGGSWKFRTKLCDVARATASNFIQPGLALIESGTGKIVSFVQQNRDTLYVYYWTNATTFSSVALSAASGENLTKYPLYLEIESDGSNLYFRTSNSGFDGTFVQVFTSAINAFFTTAPDRIGLSCNNDTNANAFTAFFDWFRRVA